MSLFMHKTVQGEFFLVKKLCLISPWRLLVDFKPTQEHSHASILAEGLEVQYNAASTRPEKSSQRALFQGV